MQVHYDELSNMVVEQWQDYNGAHLKADLFKESMMAILAAIETNKASKWLADTTHLKVLSVDSQNWAALEFMPKIINTGTITHAALMNAKDIFGLLALKNVIRKSQKQVSEKGIRVEVFSTYAEALDWLLTHHAQSVS